MGAFLLEVAAIAVKSATFTEMIRIEKYDELSEGTLLQLHQAIHAEFGHIPIVQETSWATPHWTILYMEDERILSFYNIIERNILIDGVPCKAGGINNVITPPEHRGKGYATRLLNNTRHFLFTDLRCGQGLLLCADAMIPYYNQLGWYTVNSEVYFDQPQGRQLWAANTMLLSPGTPITPASIDLQGLPW